MAVAWAMLAMLTLPPAAPPNTPVLAIDGYVVADRANGRWRAANPEGENWRARPVATFREIGLGPVGGVTRAGLVAEEVPAGVYLREPTRGAPGVLVAGITPRVPRRVLTYGTISATYTKLLRGFLDRNGLKGAKARITKLVRVDLDGDGTQEVLIEARNRDDLDARGLTVNFGPTDYSVVLLRAIRQGRVVEIPLAPGPKPVADGLVRRIRAIADLDGDGRMEVVTSYTAWEAFGGGIWKYAGGRATRLVEDGTGV